jgi:hypothetical protein
VEPVLAFFAAGDHPRILVPAAGAEHEQVRATAIAPFEVQVAEMFAFDA